MKRFAVVCFAVVALMVLAGCTTNDLSTAEVGWSNYSDIVAKDFEVVGIVTATAQEVHSKSPFWFSIKTEGGTVTYADLMQKAAAMGADDIINIRVDKREESSMSWIFDFIKGSKKTYTYTATATAIKYTTASPNAPIRQSGAQSASLPGSGSGGGFGGLPLPF